VKIRIANDVKQITAGQRVFKLHAGRNKAFLDAFSNSKRIWMELPNLDVSALRIVNDEFDEESKKQIQRAKANSDYFQGRGEVQRPPEDLNQYHPTNGLGAQISKADPRTIAAIKSLYFDIKKGDVVVVPGRSFDGNVLVGEIASDKITQIQVEGWGQISSRRVNWLRLDRTRQSFSLGLVKQLTHPRALHIFPASMTEEVFDYAYGNWSHEGSSNLSLHVAPLDSDANEVSPQALAALNLLVMYYGRAYDQIDSGEKTSNFHKSVPQILSSNSTEYSWEGSIHSPGDIVVRIKDPLKAAFILAMLALTAQTTPEIAAQFKEQETEVIVENRWNFVPENCEIDLSEHIKTALTHMGLDIWIANCKAQQELIADQLEISSSTKLVVEQGDNDD
jgi:hypothetical protein